MRRTRTTLLRVLAACTLALTAAWSNPLYAVAEPQEDPALTAQDNAAAPVYEVDIEPDNNTWYTLPGSDKGFTVYITTSVTDPETGDTTWSSDLVDGDTLSYAIAEDRISPEGSTVTQDADDPQRFWIHVPETAQAYDTVYVTVRIASADGTTAYEDTKDTAQVRNFYYQVQIEDAEGNVLGDIYVPDGEETVTVYPKLYRIGTDGISDVTDVTWQFQGDDCLSATKTDDGGYKLAFLYDDTSSGSLCFSYETSNETPDIADDSGQSQWFWVYRDEPGVCEHDWSYSLLSWPSDDGPGALAKTCVICGNTEEVEVWKPEESGTSYATDDAAFMQLFGLLFSNNLGDIGSASPKSIVDFTRLVYNIDYFDENGGHAVCLSYQDFVYRYVNGLFLTHSDVGEYLTSDDYVFVDGDALVFLSMTGGFGDDSYLEWTNTETTSTGSIMHGRWLTNPSKETPEGEEGVDWVAREGEFDTQYYTIGDKVRIVLDSKHRVTAYELDTAEDIAEVAKVATRRDTDDFNFIYPAGTNPSDQTILMFLGLQRTDDGSDITDYTASVSDVDERTKLVTFTGTGAYTGTLTKEVNLIPVTIEVAPVPFRRSGYPGNDSVSYVTMTADLGGRTQKLVYKQDFSVGYEGGYGIGADKLLLIWGLGDYYGWIEAYSYDMVGDIAKTTVRVGALTYTGNNLSPKVTVAWQSGYAFDEMKAPVAGTDYTVAYKDASGKVVSAPKAAGNYTVVITGKGLCTGTNTKAFTVAKANNPMRASGKTVNLSHSKVKSAKQTIKREKAIKVSKQQGTVTYAKKSGNKKISINKKTGVITVKKGLAKGTYKVKIKVKAAGNANYKASSKKVVTVTIKVK